MMEAAVACRYALLAAVFGIIYPLLTRTRAAKDCKCVRQWAYRRREAAGAAVYVGGCNPDAQSSRWDAVSA